MALTKGNTSHELVQLGLVQDQVTGLPLHIREEPLTSERDEG
jgi:hypothetical protein